MRRAGFTLLEVMMALLLLATAIMILVQSQTTAVHLQEQATRINTATMLASDVMTALELRMAKEGFGELEVHERGDFHDQRFADAYEDFRWEYEVEKVDLDKLPDLTNLLGLAGEGAEELGKETGIDTGGAAPTNELASLEALGVDMSFFGEMLGNFLREARVRVCYPDGLDERGDEVEDCVEMTSHLTNPTGQTADNTEEDDDDASTTPTSGGRTPTSGGGSR